VADFRTVLYKTAQAVGDYRAARRGQLGKRIVRRAIGHVTGRLLGKLFKGMRL
jgi:hypothetical protein